MIYKLFKLKERLMHPLMEKHLKLLLPHEQCTQAFLQEFTQAKLQKVLRYAVTHVPYYQEWAKTHHLGAVLKIEDFPIITKADIRGHELDFVSNEYDPEKLKKTRTSGSTGEPFMFYCSPNEFDASYAVLWRGLMRFGIRSGDKRVLVKGVDEVRRLPLLYCFKRWVYELINRCMVVDAHFLAADPKNLRHCLDRILKYKPDYFHGYASSIYELARCAEDNGIDMSVLQVKAVVTESEKLHDFQREVIERVFACPAVENYGCVEFGMIAQPSLSGELCINEDHVLLETNEDGDAILTNLDAYAFPFIRFKNGDAVQLGGRSKTLPYRTISRLDGRITERIKLPNGGSLQAFILMHPVYKLGKYIETYQIRQTAIDSVVLSIVSRCTMPEDIKTRIREEMLQILGEGVSFKINFVDTIPLTKRGKRIFVCSDVK